MDRRINIGVIVDDDAYGNDGQSYFGALLGRKQGCCICDDFHIAP